MANLTGKISDVTNQPPGSVVDIHVKAPSARVGSGTGVVVSSPAGVEYNSSTGELTITNLTGGLSWLVIEGVGWSDTVALAVSEGMTTLVEAIANAAGVPGMADYVSMLSNSESHVQQLASAAVDANLAAWGADAGDASKFRVLDNAGHVAFEVDEAGVVHAPSLGENLGDLTTLNEKTAQIDANDDAQFRVVDSVGRAVITVTAEGGVQIPTLEGVEQAEPVTILHVFLCAGQSNMEGHGSDPAYGPTSPRLFQYGARRKVLELAPPLLDPTGTANGSSPSQFFAEAYLATQPAHVGVLLVPAAVGGTGFWPAPAPADTYTWVKSASSDPIRNLYDRSVAQTQAAIAAAKSAGYLPILQGVLWHQGEGNAYVDRQPENYSVFLDEMIANYRTDFAMPRLPFILGRMAPEGIEMYTLRALIDDQHVATPTRVARTGVADAPAGHVYDEITHFDTTGNTLLGQQYFQAWYQALGNTAI